MYIHAQVSPRATRRPMASTLADKRLRRYWPEKKNFGKPRLYVYPRVGIAEGYKTSHGVDAGGQAVKALLAGEKKFRKTPPLCISTRRYRRGLQDVPWRRRWRTSG